MNQLVNRRVALRFTQRVSTFKSTSRQHRRPGNQQNCPCGDMRCSFRSALSGYMCANTGRPYKWASFWQKKTTLPQIRVFFFHTAKGINPRMLLDNEFRAIRPKEGYQQTDPQLLATRNIDPAGRRVSLAESASLSRGPRFRLLCAAVAAPSRLSKLKSNLRSDVFRTRALPGLTLESPSDPLKMGQGPHHFGK